MQFVFIGVAVLVVVAIAIVGWRMEKKRQEALAALAQQLSLRFDPGVDHGHDDEYAQFEIFRRGNSRVARNTLTGTIELFDQPCRLVAGDFRYKTTSGTGKNRRTTTHRFSYLIVHPPWRTPPLLIRPEGFFDKVKGAFGFDDIDFESAEFSRRFCVKSPDKRFAYDVVDPRMIEFLLAGNPPAIDIEYGRCCLSDGRRRWEPQQFEANLAWIGQFFDRWPQHVLASLESAS